MATRFLRILSNGNKILKSKLMTAPSSMIIFNFSFPFSIGTLLSTLTGHENDIFVLEPHPFAMNLLLTAAHDGHIIVWDLETRTMLFKHRNMIEEQGNTQGHGPVFDAKWSKDGTTICASDSHGHVLFIGHGSSERYR